MLKDYFKTTVLLALLSSLLFSVGYMIGGTGGFLASLVFMIPFNFITFFFSDKIALKMSGSQQAPADQYPELHRDLEDLCNKMNLPKPGLYIAPQSQPNAFATGRSPSHSAVSLTQGLLEKLSRDEIKAVIAHELGHIKNRDVLISTVAAVIAGAISVLTRIAFFGGGDSDSNSNILGMLITITLAPLAALLIQMAISRSREFSADSAAAKAMRSPKPLISALERIHASSRTTYPEAQKFNEAMSSLYISNPISSQGIRKLFSTHPPLEERIANLEATTL